MSIRSDFYSLASMLSEMLSTKTAAYERAFDAAADAWDASRSRTCPVYVAAQKKLRDAEISLKAAQEAFDSYWVVRNSETKLRLY